MNPNTPVIVGVGQVLNRSKDLEEAVEPILMMLDALDQAERDTGVRLLSDVSSVRVIRGVWDYGDPAGYIAKNIGCDNAETIGTLFGGNQVQAVLNRSCLEILEGKQDLVVLTGAENGSSSARARKQGVQLASTVIEGTSDEIVGFRSLSIMPTRLLGVLSRRYKSTPCMKMRFDMHVESRWMRILQGFRNCGPGSTRKVLVIQMPGFRRDTMPKR